MCSVSECERKHYAKGYCSKHYQEYLKYGNISSRKRIKPNRIALKEEYAVLFMCDKNGQEKYEVLVDIDDISLVSGYRWHEGGKGYATTWINDHHRLISMHRLLLSIPEDMEGDHINGNPLDNRRSNLRICDRTGNSMNRGMQPNNTSGVKGVVWHKGARKWQAQIKVNRKHIFLGLYEAIEDAREARKQAEIKYFGEFSREYGAASYI